jgi:hypothetical protein
MINIFQNFIAKIILGFFDFLVTKYTPDDPILPVSDIPFYNLLISNRAILLNEYMEIVKSKNLYNVKDFYKVKKDINEDDKWKAEPLILYKYLFKENAAKCPHTFQLVSKIPGCCAAMFSVLEPGKYIPPHKGIYKGIYRCLFTLKVEENADCWIRVNDVKTYFSEGSIIVFDETAEHEIRNSSSGNRVALYLDIYRKLPFPLNLYNKLVYFMIRKSPFVTNILKEYKKLEDVTVGSFIPTTPVLK